MTDRKKYTWKAQVQAETGAVSEEKVKAYWSPDYELTEQSVLTAAATQAIKKTGKPHVGISCELVS